MGDSYAFDDVVRGNFLEESSGSLIREHFDVVKSVSSPHQFFDYIENETLNPQGHLRPFTFSNIRLRANNANTGTYRPSRGDLRRQYNEDFRLIEASPNSQAQGSLEWVLGHVDQLPNALIRRRIFDFLFDYGKLEAALMNSPSALFALIERFQKRVYEDHKDSVEGIPVILWLASVTYFLQDHIQLHAGTIQYDISTINWLDTRRVLRELLHLAKESEQRAEIAQFLICSYHAAQALSKADLLDIFKNLALNATFKNKAVDLLATKTPGILVPIAEVIYKHRNAMHRCLQEFTQVELNSFCDEVIEYALVLKSQGNWRIISERAAVDDRNGFSIDLFSGEILKSNAPIVSITKQISAKLIEQLGIGDQLERAIAFPGTDGKSLVRTLDGKVEIEGDFTQSYQTVNVKKRICIDGNECWYEGWGELEGSVSRGFPPGTDKFAPIDLKRGPPPQCWFNIDRGFLLLPYDRSETCYYYSYADKGYRVVKKDLQGNFVTTGHLLNLVESRNEFETEWARFLNKFEELKHIKVEAQITKSGAEVTKLNFSRLGLNFVPVLKKGEYRLESLEYRGFYLASQQSVSELNGMSGSFILANDKREERVLLSTFNVRSSGKSAVFRTVDFFDREMDLCTPVEKIGKRQGYFHYFRKDGELRADIHSPEADLYLAVIYSMQEDYSNAVRALARTQRHDNNREVDWRIFSLLLRRPNYSHKGAAFFCKMLSRMLAHVTNWTKSRQATDERGGITCAHAIKAFRNAIPQLADLELCAKEQFAYYLSNLSTHRKDVVSCLNTYYFRRSKSGFSKSF